ncbi:hypothetical protein [Sphingomonas sp. LM7]|uniref:hypothetical protein n=1 Tax=Sphingomonas sp. LM7 TaxID=1938607 RepID=UPI0012375C50|nr:hypothetical protein [Sphingomonas sp. LM7]
MSDEVPTWTLDEHLRRGEEVIGLLPTVEADYARVCFHLNPADYNEEEPWSEEASYNQIAKPLFDAARLPLSVDYVGGTSGIEAWENVVPTVEWLHERIPVLVGLADRAGLQFGGWSFEPREPRDISYFSCGPTLDVVNRYSPEGQAAIDDLIASSTSKAVDK